MQISPCLDRELHHSKKLWLARETYRSQSFPLRDTRSLQFIGQKVNLDDLKRFSRTFKLPTQSSEVIVDEDVDETGPVTDFSDASIHECQSVPGYNTASSIPITKYAAQEVKMAATTSKLERCESQLGVDIPRATRGRSMERTNDTPSPEPPGSDERFGDVAPEGMSFCPILAVAKFPYKYISKRFSESVSDKFFNKGQFWNRKWDLYWVWSPYCDPGKPYMFVPLDQFKQLVKEIDQRFSGCGITIPAGAEEIGLVVNFEDHPECRPRWLGKAASKDDYDLLEVKATLFETPPHDPPEKTLEAFKEKIEVAINATRQKNSKATKEAKKEQRLLRQQDMGRAFKRAQRYLGLRPKTTTEDGLSRIHSPEARPIDFTDSAPFPFDGDVIFIAVDAEAWERNHNIVTEIGFATLDTRDLHNIPPGKNGENWRQKIRARHFRIEEYMHLGNHEFVQGCADRFDFGTSEFISLQDSPRVVADCFKPPYSAVEADQLASSNSAEKRHIVFLGHDTQQDVQYLQKIGYDINNLTNLLEFQDTASMYRVFSQEPNPRNLGHVLYVCEVEAWNMHNAGNDAVYTMQAMLGLCVKDAVENRGEAERSRERQKIEHAKKEVEERVREEAKGWALNDSDDGGVSIKMTGLKISDHDASGQSCSPKASEWEM